MSDVSLERFEANSFMGIDKSKPVVIDFTPLKKNKGVVEFIGDEGLCKTSALCGILYAMGAAFDINKKQLINKKDEAIDINFKFTHEEEKYEVVITADRVVLKKFDEDSEKWKREDEPGNTLRRIFGPVGMSPFALRTMRGKDQIEYVQDLFGSGEDSKKKHRELEAAYDKLFEQRRDVNRDIKNIKGFLETEPLYKNFQASEEKFKTPPSAKKEKENYEALSKLNNQFNNVDSEIARLSSGVSNKKNEVKELEKRLAAAKQEIADSEKKISDYEKWKTDNKDIPQKFKAAGIAFTALSNTIAEHEKWKNIIEKKKELDELEQSSQRATATLQELETDMLKLTSSYLPKIPGLKLKVRPSIDKDKEEIGLYYNEFTMAQLNESEFAKLWAKVFIAKEMNFLFFENLNSYGSGAVSVINELAKQDGVIVFGSRMDRKKKHLEIAFNSKVD